MWKEKLDNINDIANYVSDLDANVDVEFLSEYLREFGTNCYALLNEVNLSMLQLGNENNHIMNSSKQHQYNNKQKDTMPPILIDSEYNIIDGHHRYRSAIRRNDDMIKVYKIMN